MYNLINFFGGGREAYVLLYFAESKYANLER